MGSVLLFWLYKERKSDFFVNNRLNHKKFGIGVKVGSPSEKTVERLLRDNRGNRIYMLKWDIFGSMHEKMYTIQLYLISLLEVNREIEE